MKTFDDFTKENFKNLTSSTREFMREAFKAGQESRQAEIDELQKRIDDALVYLRHTDSREQSEKVLYRILKGNQND